MLNCHKIEILILDELTLFSEGMLSIFSLESAIKVVGITKNILDCLKIVRSSCPDIVLIDSNLFDSDIAPLLKRIKEYSLETRIMILIGQNPEGNIENSLNQGVSGFLLKDCTKNELIDGIKKVVKGEVYFSQGLSAYLRSITVDIPARISNSKFAFAEEAAAENKDSIDVLTKRESEIIELLAKGLKNKEIAVCLGITERTVEYHVGHILDKLGVRSRLEAVVNYKFKEKSGKVYG